MTTDILYIDFSKDQYTLPKVSESWQQEIIDFIEYYQGHNEIPVQTSGSTGEPKQYKLPKKAMQQSAQRTADFLDLKIGDTAMLCMPVSYIAGKMMIVRAMEVRMKLICVEPKSKIKYTGEINFCALTPMQAEASLDYLKSDFIIDKLILGGAKVSGFLEQKLSSIDTEVYETYGMTETITHIAMRKLGEQQYFHTLKGVKISQNGDGCLQIKTSYFPDVIETNDLVEIKNDSEFKIIGRVDHIINSGGLKINPEDLEQKLKPYIQEPYIIHFKPDDLLGQRVILLIESDKEIAVEYPADLIPKNKQPKEIHYIPSFPRTKSGKIQRKKIKL
ncbi:AMP-binding protein [Flavobacteriaceae bacterium Ap0902]|nr:AMP-binding protein [Flavobacteriaceae bacterium Ap0902]